MFVYPGCFGVCCRPDVCLLSNIMKLDGSRLVVLKEPKNIYLKLKCNVSFQKSTSSYSGEQTDLCPEQFRSGTTYEAKLSIYQLVYVQTLTHRHGYMGRDLSMMAELRI